MATKKLQILDSIISTDTNLTEEGKPADAKATGNAINNLNSLVGDTSVSTQISEAVADKATYTIIREW